jgi:hypothetical protein
MFVHKPHPRIAERKVQGPVKVADQRPMHSAFARFNTRLGVKVTASVGTMVCAYLFCALALISLPAAIGTHSAIVIVSWIAQTFFQLVLLPVVIVGQNVQAAAADRRAEATFADASATLHEAEQIQKHLLDQDARLDAQDQILTQLVATLSSIIAMLNPSSPPEVSA